MLWLGCPESLGILEQLETLGTLEQLVNLDALE